MYNYFEFDIAKAVKICYDAHDGQMYGEVPYFYHPMMVAYLVGHMGYSFKYIIAAYLHDVVEDSSYKISDISYHFGDEIADAVDALTKKVDPETGDDEPYQEYLERIIENDIAGVVKYADLYHNYKISGRDTEKYRDAFEFVSSNIELMRKPMDFVT
jgi:(p)ppGpp synthase/HD superfamily hydrolase